MKTLTELAAERLIQHRDWVKAVTVLTDEELFWNKVDAGNAFLELYYPEASIRYGLMTEPLFWMEFLNAWDRWDTVYLAEVSHEDIEGWTLDERRFLYLEYGLNFLDVTYRISPTVMEYVKIKNKV